MAETTHVNIRFACHVCKEASYARREKLIEHLSTKEEINIPSGKPGKRAVDKSVVHVKASEVADYEKQGVIVKTYNGCPVCADYFVDINDYKYHLEKFHLGVMDDDYSLIANGPIIPIGIAPSTDIVSTDEQVVVKRAKTAKEAIARMYGDEARPDDSKRTMIEGILSSMGMQLYSIQAEDGSECFSFVAKDHLPSVMNVCLNKSLTVTPCSTEINTTASDMHVTASINDGHLDYLISSKKINTKPLTNDYYSEITTLQLDTLNQDWHDHEYLAAVCAQILAGCILVNNEQVLLVNCIEIYNRFRHLDAHSERHSPRSNSLPTGEELYHTLAIRNMANDNSHKLVIGTHAITALVTSSLRLDKHSDPELGPSTISFHPSKTTRLFLSSDSLNKANKLLIEKKAYVNVHDKYAQLKQVRSNFTTPSTYRLARCCSKFTDNLFSRPYTLFTIYTMESGDEFGDLKLGSKIFRLIASAIFREQRSISQEDIEKLAPVDKDTHVHDCYKKILSLNSDVQGQIKIFGNQDLERILVDIAERLAPRLKEANSKVAKLIKESAQ